MKKIITVLAITLFAALFIGFTSVVPQLLIPLGAQLAKPQKRGSAIGSIMSGILVGILLSRVFSGYIAQFYNWKTIYIIAAFIMFILAVILRFTLPHSPALNKIKYSQSLYAVVIMIGILGFISSILFDISKPFIFGI